MRDAYKNKTKSDVPDDAAGRDGQKEQRMSDNVDEESGLAARFGVQSIPSFVFIKDGRVVDMITGAMPKPVLRNYLEDLAAG